LREKRISASHPHSAQTDGRAASRNIKPRRLGKPAFATMGPYLTKAGARDAADAARVLYYRIADG